MAKQKILAKENLDVFFASLKQTYEVFAPIRLQDTIHWGCLEETREIVWEFVNTEMSPKKFFFPQTECMMRFINKADDSLGMIMQSEPLLTSQRILFNIRPCDAKAIQILDLIFMQDEITNDIYWRDKREKTILIGLACNNPCPTCFCASVNCGPYSEIGLDLLLVDLGNKLLVKVITPRGDNLTKKLPLADEAEIKNASDFKVKAEASIISNVSIDKINSSKVMSLYELSIWEQIMDNCLNCGICTFCCPTCHCFDIQDEMQGENGRRIRNWDYCMSWLFTMHASGHNPRATKKDRLRQRFMHKFKYIPMKRGGEIGCVGCGRCIHLCPVNIDVRIVANQINNS